MLELLERYLGRCLRLLPERLLRFALERLREAPQDDEQRGAVQLIIPWERLLSICSSDLKRRQSSDEEGSYDPTSRRG